MPALAISAVDPATDQLTVTAHGLNTGDGPAAIYTPAGVIPGGLAAVTDYWVIKVDADTLKLASSSTNANAGVAIDITDAGSGTLQLLRGLPYRRATTYAAGSQVKSADLDAIQDQLVVIWNLFTGQVQTVFGDLAIPHNVTADALYFDQPVTRTLGPLASTDVINGAPSAVHQRNRAGWTFAATSTPIWYAMDFLRGGDVVTAINCTLTKVNGATETITMEIIHTTLAGDFVDPDTTFTNSAAPGTWSLGGATNLEIVGARAYWLRFTPASMAGDSISEVTVSYKRPKP